MTIIKILLAYALAFTAFGMFVVPAHMGGVELIERVAETLRTVGF